MRLHFPSVAIGVVTVSLMLVSMSLATTPPAGPPRIEYGPSPRDMVQIREGTPYVVPPGKLFVLTGLGRREQLETSVLVQLRVNGQQEAAGGYVIGAPASPANVASVSAVPSGFTAVGGSTLEVMDPASVGMRGRAWGYLANQ